MGTGTETLATATRWGADFLADLYRRYGHELADLDAVTGKVGDIGKSYDAEERRVLYLMARHVAPDVVFEFSPKRGWTTVHVAAALERNGKGRILSFELEPVYAWVARRTLRRAGLAHRARFFVGDVREELPPAYERLRAAGEIDGIQFLFIDSDHGGEFARWYVDNLFPLVRPGGVIHVHDVVAAPERIVRGEASLREPTGEERVVAEHLVRHSDRYRSFSLADLVRDRAYLDAVRPLGGGAIALPPGRAAAYPTIQAVGFEPNPSLWILNTGEQQADRYPGVKFPLLERTLAQKVRYAVTKRLAPVYAPIRELRRDIRQRAKRRPARP